MSRLRLTNEKLADVIDRVIFVALPGGLVWFGLSTIPYALGAVSLGGEVIADPSTILLSRALSIALGVFVGVPLAWLITAKAEGYGLLEESSAGLELEADDRSGDGPTSSDP